MKYLILSSFLFLVIMGNAQPKMSLKEDDQNKNKSSKNLKLEYHMSSKVMEGTAYVNLKYKNEVEGGIYILEKKSGEEYVIVDFKEVPGGHVDFFLLASFIDNKYQVGDEYRILRIVPSKRQVLKKFKMDGQSFIFTANV